MDSLNVDQPAGEENETEMNGMMGRLYEKYDYIVFVFDDMRDFIAAQELVGLEKVRVSVSPKNKSLGLGRVVKGERLFQIAKRGDK